MNTNSSGYKLEPRACPACSKVFDCPRTAPASRACSADCGYRLRTVRGTQSGAGEATPAPAVIAGEPDESRTETDTELTLSLNRTRIKTLDELLAACEVDTAVWECYRFVANKWEVGAKDLAGRIQVEPLFQVKAWFRKRVQVAAALDEIRSLREDEKTAAVRRPTVRYKPGRCMLELSIPDLHLGKLAWHKETGWSDYDSGIARQCYEDALDALLARAAGHALDEIVLVVGNDLLNSDNKNHTTTRGTPQTSTDTRYQKTFRDAREMTAAAVKRCYGIARTRIVMVSGNHDELSVWHLGDSLECLFGNTGGVTIDNGPRMRKYHQFGQVGLMWTHGDKGKHAGYPLLFAKERPDIWGATKWQEVHLGHLHQTRVNEHNGVRVRILPSLCAADAWHSEMGFVGAVRAAEAFVWDRDEGLIGTAVYQVPDQGAT